MLTSGTGCQQCSTVTCQLDPMTSSLTCLGHGFLMCQRAHRLSEDYPMYLKTHSFIHLFIYRVVFEPPSLCQALCQALRIVILELGPGSYSLVGQINRCQAVSGQFDETTVHQGTCSIGVQGYSGGQAVL